ncbi:trypsin-like serine protease [Verrucosispora sp. WMMD573]|uniref:S1 family peptidase n=1 Tax=Verrucosispora sp. WMMD573 TaxID=3015149 RepID=UPI00248B1C23|nr:trypsin-like serine protease [Verrucosispora sp. WMMD573]WBB52258.1 trypsin-like serine protease [Verrucosispora sp. WMMD573]
MSEVRPQVVPQPRVVRADARRKPLLAGGRTPAVHLTSIEILPRIDILRALHDRGGSRSDSPELRGMFVRRRVGAWTGAVVMAVVAVGLSAGGPAFAIAGAEAVTDSRYPFVGKVYFGETRSCTAVLVDARWIATGKACFSDGGAGVVAGVSAEPATVVFGRVDLTRVTGHRLAVVSVVPHPDRNLALGELSGPVKDITPIAVGAAPVAGEVLRVAGFGRTATEWVPDRMHTDTVAVGAVSGTSFTVTGTSPGVSLCKGDAGGPAFREVQGRFELVGINDVSWQKGCLGETETRDGAIETRADDLGEWIRGNVTLQPHDLREPVVGEFNRDGVPDLLAADSAGQLWLYPGTGIPRVWGARIQVASGWGGYRDLVVGRIDRDGYDDVAVVESATGRLWLFPGAAAGGGFGARVQIGSGWTDMRDLAIGRVNRDGYDDLIAVESSTQRLLMWSGRSAGGQFNASVQIGSGWGCCQQVTLGRFNGDEYDDLLTVQTATGRLLIYAGNAAGTTFDAGVDTGTGATWNSYSYLAAGRDPISGRDSLIAVDAPTGQTWLHTRLDNGGWAPRVMPDGRVWSPRPYELSNLVTGEFTRDAHTDILGVDANGIAWLYPGTTGHGWGARIQVASGWGGYRDLVVGRIDRDGYDDVAVVESATGRLWLFPGAAAGGGFGARVQIGSGWTGMRDLAIGRVNRDGYDDLIAVESSTQRLLMWSGRSAGGQFNASVQIGSGWGCCQQVTLGRFNGDEYDDLLTVQTATGRLLIYAGNAAGTTFDAGVDTGAGTNWANHIELTAIRPAGDIRHSLLSKDPTGALLLHPTRYYGGHDWAVPIRFGPRVGAVSFGVAAALVGIAVAAGTDVPTENNGGSIVEDFSYPGAGTILAEQNIELISGDGHIVLANCAMPPTGDIGLLEVWTTDEIGQGGIGRICFDVLGPVGRLDLRVPAVYEVRGDGRRQGAGHNGTATVTTDDGVVTTKDLDPSGSIQFGIGEGEDREPTTLLQLTIKP